MREFLKKLDRKYIEKSMKENLINKYISNKRFEIYDSIDRYNGNLKKSKSLYIPLSILEVSLRNSINSLFEKLYSRGWLINEANFLRSKELNKIITAKEKISLLSF